MHSYGSGEEQVTISCEHNTGTLIPYNILFK
jgi:hypothetical protein